MELKLTKNLNNKNVQSSDREWIATNLVQRKIMWCIET